MSFAGSHSMVSALMDVVQEWNTFFQEFRQRDFEECAHAHACFHGAVYILVGMVSSTSLTEEFLAVSLHLNAAYSTHSSDSRSKTHSSDFIRQTLGQDADSLNKLRLMPHLLQEEIQYSTQEMSLELLSR
jgi:hypothetical protein